MTALPLNPTDDELFADVRLRIARGTSPGGTYQARERAAAFQAGVEAERARAAAAVRKVHAKDSIKVEVMGIITDMDVCAHCSYLTARPSGEVYDDAWWPCDTIEALDGKVQS